MMLPRLFLSSLASCGVASAGVHVLPAADSPSLVLLQTSAVLKQDSDRVEEASQSAKPVEYKYKFKASHNVKTFEDVTPWAYPAEWYTWNHAGYPRSHQGTPTFVDFNKDGSLDFLYHNHYQADPANDWDIGLSRGTNQKNATNLYGSSFWESVGEKLVRCSEPEDSKWKSEPAMDNHGTAVIDIDRDGLLDIYMAVGGGDGWVGGPSKNAVLMWGKKDSTTVLNQVFIGGRDVSEKANLHNKNSRGRFNYWADFNKDGLLDVVFSNEPRDDAINAYGYMLLNNGDRTFEDHKELSEYTETMVLTDADGDGHAEEFVVQRRDCAFKACKYAEDYECKKLKIKNKDWYDFCTDRPEGSTAVYKWSHRRGKLVNVAPKKHSTMIGAKNHAMSMQTADFDGDEKIDLAVLYPDRLEFFYSSRRAPGELPIGRPSEVEQWTKDECVGVALRVADLNLDGHNELLVLCFENKEGDAPKHRLYTGGPEQWVHKANQVLMGDLHNTDLIHPTKSQLEGACHGDIQSLPGYLRKGCTEYNGGEAKGHLLAPRSMGLSVVDWNNDGFADVAVSYDFGQMLLLQNNFGALRKRNYLAVKLVGTTSNEYGVGATVLLKCRKMGIDRANMTQLREVNTVSHELDWFGTRDDRIIFGLGLHGIPVSLAVRWPNQQRTEQVITSEKTLRKYMNNMKDLLIVTEKS